MTWKIEFDWSHGLVKVTYDGEISIADSLRAKKDYLSNPNWHPGMNILVDFRQTILTYPGLDELRRKVIFHAERSQDYGANRIAYVVKNKRDFGIARQITSLLEIYTNSQTGVFMDENEAIEWLKASN